MNAMKSMPVMERPVELRCGAGVTSPVIGLCPWSTDHSFCAGGFYLHTARTRGGKEVVVLKPDAGPTTTAVYPDRDCALAEFRRLAALLRLRQWTSDLLRLADRTALIPASFVPSIRAGDDPALTLGVAADYLDDSGNTDALWLRAFAALVEGRANVLHTLGSGATAWLNVTGDGCRLNIAGENAYHGSRPLWNVRVAVVVPKEYVAVRSLDLDVRPGESCARERAFRVGDSAAYGSTWAGHFGPIRKITPKTITIPKRWGDGMSVMTISRFADLNQSFDRKVATRDHERATAEALWR